nr:transposase [Nostoc sp. 'Peltigera malacea cyanobiont' DB3992]
MILKETSDSTEYLLDSFTVPICDNIRIFQVLLIQSQEYRAEPETLRLRVILRRKNRYFYGVRMQLLATKSSIPVEYVFLLGSANDVRALNALQLNLPPGSEVYTDSAYTNYTAEDDLEESSQISLKVMRKKNSKRQDSLWEKYIKQCTRHYIETVFSSITCVFPLINTCSHLSRVLLKLEALFLLLPFRQAFIELSNL